MWASPALDLPANTFVANLIPSSTLLLAEREPALPFHEQASRHHHRAGREQEKRVRLRGWVDGSRSGEFTDSESVSDALISNLYYDRQRLSGSQSWPTKERQIFSWATAGIGKDTRWACTSSGAVEGRIAKTS